MPYIGKSPVGGGFHKLDALTASATATYALTLGSAAYFPETANQLLVSLNGVIQAPQDSFTVSGSNLIFDTALTASDSIDFVVALGDVLGVGSVTDGAVTTNKIGTDAVTTAKIQDGAVTAAKIGSLPTGSVLQVKSMKITAPVSTTSTSYIDTGLTLNITPSSTSSKILISYDAGVGISASAGGQVNRIMRDTTELMNRGVHWSTAGSSSSTTSSSYLDSPATTSAITYKIQFLTQSASSTVTFNNGFTGYATPTANLTLMEIAG